MTSNLSRDEMVELIHKKYMDNDAITVNRSLQSDEIIKLQYEASDEMSESILRNPDKYLSDSMINKYICFALSNHYRYLGNIKLYHKYNNIGIKLGVPECIYSGAIICWNNKEYKESLSMFQQALDVGWYIAYRDIAEIYYDGKGVNKNDEIAIEYYCKYLLYVKNGIIVGNTEYLIPSGLKSIIERKLDYQMHKYYDKISHKLKNVIPITGLREIIIEYY